MVIFKNTAAILSQDISNTYIKNQDIVYIYAYQGWGNGGSPSVPVPVILKQFNNAIKFLIFCPYYYSSVKFS